MAFILYCKVCTMPPEYCRYSNKYPKCIEWMKNNHSELFEKEICDLQQRNPKVFKKVQLLLNNNNNNNKKNNKQKTNNNDNNNNNFETHKVQFVSNKILIEQNKSNQQINDIQNKLSALSTAISPNSNSNQSSVSPTKSILKNAYNPNKHIEMKNIAKNITNNQNQNQNRNRNNNFDDDDSDNEFNVPDALLQRNNNRNVQVKGRKHKQKGRRRWKGKGKRNKRNRNNNNNPNNSDDNDNDNQQQQQQVAPMQQQVINPIDNSAKKNVKIRDKKNKKTIEVMIQNRKGNKRVTCIRGLLELNMKEKDAKKAFRQKFATGVGCNYINGDNGAKEFVLQGDVRYDLMKFMRQKYGVPAKLLFYKKKGNRLYPACNDQGIALPPPP